MNLLDSSFRLRTRRALQPSRLRAASQNLCSRSSRLAANSVRLVSRTVVAFVSIDFLSLQRFAQNSLDAQDPGTDVPGLLGHMHFVPAVAAVLEATPMAVVLHLLRRLVDIKAEESAAGLVGVPVERGAGGPVRAGVLIAI